MGKKIHVIPHTHWDREWYFTTSRSKIYLMNNLNNILDVLEKDHNFKFMLDAQASLLDDYVNWMPENIDRIKKLVRKKQLIIGPWYTQTDQMVISAESIVRNLYYGMKRCSDFGGYMNVGYVPDSFGQAGNMPQIYKSFGIEDTLFWRGVSDDMIAKTDFLWEGDDGSKVFVTQIPFGYYIGGNIPETNPESKKFWEEECLKKAGERSSTDNIYFPNGFDQAPIRNNLSEILKKRQEEDPENEYVISSIEEYIKDVKSANPTLETVKGELLIAKHMRIHKSIYSSRSDLKQMNTKIQNYITNVLEPILVMSSLLHNPYPKEVMSTIWKLMFENAAHDSIGSCISDEANEDVFMRYKQALDLSVNLVELHTRLISTSLKSKENKITINLFNTLPWDRNDSIEFMTYIPGEKFLIKDSKGKNVPYTILEKKDLTDYVLSQTINLNPSKKIYIPEKVYEARIVIYKKDIISFGYEQLYLSFESDGELKKQNLKRLENEYYEITINENGSFNVFDKVGKELFENQGVLVENGDDGDSFNYSPPRKDMKILSTDCTSKKEIEGSELIQKAHISFEMKLPKDLNERAVGNVSESMPIEMIVGLRKNSKTIDIKVHVKNTVLSHRLCILFDSGIKTKINIADQQFGTIMRPNVYEKEMELYNKCCSNDICKENTTEPVNWQQSTSSWQEPPIAIEPCQSFVSLTNDFKTVSVFPQGVREYEIIGNNKNIICLTLFRTYGFMGKENLLYRPGRASGEKIIETPDAQLLKDLEFNCGVYYSSKSFNEANVANVAKEYNTPLVIKEYSEFLNGRLIFSEIEKNGIEATKFSLFKKTGNLVVSAIKHAEEKDGLIIRLYNGNINKKVDDKLIFNKKIKEAYFVNLKEEKIDEINHDEQEIIICNVGHCKFISVFVRV